MNCYLDRARLPLRMNDFINYDHLFVRVRYYEMGHCTSASKQSEKQNIHIPKPQLTEEECVLKIKHLLDSIDCNNESNDNSTFNTKFNDEILFGSGHILHLILRLHQRFDWTHFAKLTKTTSNIRYDVIGNDLRTPLMLSCLYRTADKRFTEHIISTQQCNPHYVAHRHNQTMKDIPSHALQCCVYSNNYKSFALLISKLEWNDEEYLSCLRFLIRIIDQRVVNASLYTAYFSDIINHLSSKFVSYICNQLKYTEKKIHLLFWAYQYKPIFIALLNINAFDLNICDDSNHKYSLLHQAVIDGDTELIHVLVNSNISLSLCDNEGNNILHLMCKHCHQPKQQNIFPMIAELLAKDIMSINNEKNTCIDILRSNKAKLDPTQYHSFMDLLQRLSAVQKIEIKNKSPEIVEEFKSAIVVETSPNEVGDVNIEILSTTNNSGRPPLQLLTPGTMVRYSPPLYTFESTGSSVFLYSSSMRDLKQRHNMNLFSTESVLVDYNPHEFEM
eukprot:169940_1